MSLEEGQLLMYQPCLPKSQVAGVQYVIDTVIYALLANPDRKFAYAEMVSHFLRVDCHPILPSISPLHLTPSTPPLHLPRHSQKLISLSWHIPPN